MLAYLHWQFFLAPRWLLETFWNLELALLQYFSVGLMLRTLFAHWHKDAVPYNRGSFGQIFLSFAWNQISRTIGFIIRASVLFVWLVVQVLYLSAALGFFLAFLTAPFAIIAALVAGFILVI